MLPVVDKPLIQYAVEEAAAAGITDLIFVTGRNKRAIEDHFDKAYELETELALRRQDGAARDACRRPRRRGINCIYIRQAEALGLGHAVLCAQPVVGDEPFAVLLADDLIDAQPPVMKQMVESPTREGCSLLGVRRSRARGDRQLRHRRARRARREGAAPHRAHRREAGARDAPSTLAVVGRYVLTPRIFDLLRDACKPGAAARSSSPTRIAALLARGAVLAYEFEGHATTAAASWVT